MYWFILIGGVALIIVALMGEKNKRLDSYLTQYQQRNRVETTLTRQAVNFASLSDRSLRQGLKTRWDNLKRQLGRFALLKIMLYTMLVMVLALVVNSTFTRFAVYELLPFAVPYCWWFGYQWLQKREQKQFDETFPDALNMLASAISAGESIGRGIMYVGDNLEGEVGREFKLMGERLKMGESIDEVFRKSCLRFPNPNFHFFVITLRANMQRGGQLKEIMTRLNRQMFEARAVERKKFALTSEARISAKIVSATPFFFLFILQFLSPENFEFVMFNPEGRPLLYYLVISEAIGMAIIWALMKRVK
ncbi:type II secretion system F family protein [Vibrio sp. HENC-03]|uniref:type II secretion system F family protein n=1 Tax=Vibrio sp. HENC-03 TaxID=992012 RepID=UPI00028DBE7E|nr:type II secretion system F family protein [Vibrio sp. HENC-03]EKM21455.1 bacterial type II secretion system F domain protein [Vibrio sp. HENC-03]